MRVSPDGQKLVEITDIPNPTSPRINVNDGSLWVVSQQSMLIKLSTDGTKAAEFPGGMAIVAISVLAYRWRDFGWQTCSVQPSPAK